MAFLGGHQNPYSQPYLDSLAAARRSIEATGVPPAAAAARALGLLHQQLIVQAGILAYVDVFTICAVLTFCMVPIALLLSPVKSGAAAPGEGAH